MKKNTFLISFVALCSVLFAQAPQGFKYQAVVRDGAGEILASQAIDFRLSIRENAIAGPIIYQETHTANTNQFGLANMTVGQGTPTTGVFQDIAWGDGLKFLEVEVDLTGTFESLGTAELLSVPYAFYDGDWTISGDDIYTLNNGNVGIGTSTPSVKLDIRGADIDNGALFYLSNSDRTHILDFFPGKDTDPNPFIRWKDSDPLRFSTDAGPLGFTELMRISPDGNVGIGDNTPLATLTVGNGDKLQISGNDGDIFLKDDQGSLKFGNASGESASMIYMFPSGTNNATRMFVAHSPPFDNWGIRYNDTIDAFTWIGDNIPVLHVQLAGQQRVGIGTEFPESKLHVSTNSATGFGQIKLTETQLDYSRITMNNTINNNFWDIAAITDTDLANTKMNIYHSDAGNIFTLSALGRVGVNNSTPQYAMELNGNGSSRALNIYNSLPTTTGTTYNYGIRVGLDQAANTGFPRLYNVYAISTDADAYLTYGLYAYASGASSNNYGVYAYAPTSSGYAGYFSGNVYTTGSYLPSDAKLKSDVKNYDQGLDIIMALKPVAYKYNTTEYAALNLPSDQQYGFVAQDVKMVLPELIKSTFQPYDEALSDTEEGQGIWFEAVNYTGLIPQLVSAVQQQQLLIEKKDLQIQEMKDALNNLEERMLKLESHMQTLHK